MGRCPDRCGYLCAACNRRLLLAIALAFVGTWVLFSLLSCESHAKVTPASSSVTSTVTTEYGPPAHPAPGCDTTPPGPVTRVTESKTATSHGAGLNARGHKVELDEFDASAPGADLDGVGKATGGDTSIDASIMGMTGVGPKIALTVLGAILLALSVWCFSAGNIRAGIGGAGLGLGLIGLAFFPSIILLALLAAAVVGLVWWADRNGLLKTEALRAVTAGVEAIPDKEVRTQVKALVGQHADERDRKTIRGVKRRDGLASDS